MRSRVLSASEKMKKVVYFDTNVFDHIHKGIGVTEADWLALRSAVKNGRISILLSVLNLEEALCALEQSPTQAIAELRLTLELVEKGRLVKPPSMLLCDDIRCYAQGDALLGPFITLDPAIQSNIRALVNPDQKDIDDLRLIIKETQNQKKDFVVGMRQANAKVLPVAKEFLRNHQGRPPDWQDYWERLAVRFAEGFAEGQGLLDACRNRGIKGLLGVRSVRMAVGASVSLAYAETFEKRTPKMGDSRDMQHAVLATAADAFVTHDHGLARLLDRIPMDSFQVLDLRALLQGV